jgi:hypothetical protein
MDQRLVLSENSVAMKLHYLSYERDRHGNRRVYVRRYGRRIRVREKEGTPAFVRAVANALEKLERGPALAVRGQARGTFGWLASAYMGSVEFNALDARSQRTRRGVIEKCLAHFFKGSPMRECPLSMTTPAKIKAIRDAKADKKGAANKRLKYLSAMFRWGIEAGVISSNPCRDVRRFKYASDGFHTWTVEEVHKFEERQGEDTIFTELKYMTDSRLTLFVDFPHSRWTAHAIQQQACGSHSAGMRIVWFVEGVFIGEFRGDLLVAA